MKNSLWWKEDLLCQLLQAPVHIILILSSILRWKRSGTHAHTHMQTHKNKQTKNREWDRVQNALSLQQLSVPGRKITSQKRHVTSVRLPLFAPSFQQHRGRIYSTEDPISHKQHCQNTSTYCYWLIKKRKKICHLPPANLLRNSGRNTLFFLQMARQVAHISSHRVFGQLVKDPQGQCKGLTMKYKKWPTWMQPSLLTRINWSYAEISLSCKHCQQTILQRSNRA